MEFYSAYAQGFARVAACTIPVALADPAANAETVLAQVRECHDDGVAVAIFPELCLSGYSIEDLLLQDTLLAAEKSQEVHRSSVCLLAANDGLPNSVRNCEEIFSRKGKQFQ